jgi:ABC-type branched-subunit amino acid transport system ATPase component
MILERNGSAAAGGGAAELGRIAIQLAAFVEPDADALTARAAPVPITDSIVLVRVCYHYDEGSFALRDLSLRIAKGERIGIAGPSGNSKSTLLDLLMGLLEPRSGVLVIDGRPVESSTWAVRQAAIAHVPPLRCNCATGSCASKAESSESYPQPTGTQRTFDLAVAASTGCLRTFHAIGMQVR